LKNLKKLKTRKKNKKNTPLNNEWMDEYTSGGTKVFAVDVLLCLYESDFTHLLSTTLLSSVKQMLKIRAS
jgi:hypothetical protein